MNEYEYLLNKFANKYCGFVANSDIEELFECFAKMHEALDKACEMLAMNEESITLDSSYHDKEQWKDYLLKDEPK